MTPEAEHGGAGRDDALHTLDLGRDEPEDEQGMPVLSKIKADRIKNWEKIQAIYEEALRNIPIA